MTLILYYKQGLTTDTEITRLNMQGEKVDSVYANETSPLEWQVAGE